MTSMSVRVSQARQHRPPVVGYCANIGVSRAIDHFDPRIEQMDHNSALPTAQAVGHASIAGSMVTGPVTGLPGVMIRTIGPPSNSRSARRTSSFTLRASVSRHVA